MASDEDVLDTEVADGVLDNGVGVKVSGRDNVADVAVHEDLARTKAHDLVGRHTAVSASKVEVLRLLRTTDSLYIELGQTTIQHNCASPKYLGSLAVSASTHFLLFARTAARSSLPAGLTIKS